MAKVFTKLNLGDVVASGGGRVWKKLTVGKGNDLPDSGVDPATREITDSWEQIATAISEGVYSTRYAVGDTKKMTLTDGTTVDMQIVAFDADDKADGSGKAAITWISKDIVTKQPINANYTESGWGASTLRAWLRNDFYATLPAEVTNAIVAVNKTYHVYNGNPATKTISDTVWIPSFRELSTESYELETSGADYTAFFTDYTSCVKTYNGSADKWWIRSTARNNASIYLTVDRKGDGGADLPDVAHGVVLGFCM